MSRLIMLLLGLLAALVGCDGGGYQRKSGQWLHNDVAFTPTDPASFKPIDKLFARDSQSGYYRGSAVDGSDGASFEVLSEHEARDRLAVYYCDTYRKGQEYWTVRHLKVDRIRDADPATYTVLGRGYARDRLHVYEEGVAFEVRDVASFEPLAGGFARDAQRGYYERVEIAGSHGATFKVIDDRDASYAHDQAIAFHAHIERNEPNKPPHPVVRKLRDAELATLRVLGRGYAADTKRVWYEGERVAGADAQSFTVTEDFTAQADAKDKTTAWQRGQRVAEMAASAASR
jgi:hypothetical protein